MTQLNKNYPVGEYAIVRSRDQGVMCGTVLDVDGRKVTLANARQMYRWRSNFVLVELASYGPVGTKDQRYSAPSAHPVVFLEACGILPCTADARRKLEAIPAEEHQ